MSKVSEEHARRWLEVMPVILRRLNAAAGEAAGRLELSPTQAAVVCYLSETSETTMGELSDHICVSLSAMTGVVDRLVQKKAVSRGRDERDRRVVKVSLTSAGKRLATDVFAMRKAYATALLGALGEADRKQLLDIMARLAQNLPLVRASNA